MAIRNINMNLNAPRNPQKQRSVHTCLAHAVDTKKVGASATKFAGTADSKPSTFKFLRKAQVHIEVKSTDLSYNSKYIILEAKHGLFIYVIIN